MTTYRTSLGRARGLGSAKHGVGHWIVERLSSIALVPLVIWAVWAGLTLAGGGYDGAVQWLRSPVNAVLTILLLIVGFWHMQVGLRVVIEDYIHAMPAKVGLLILNLLVTLLGVSLAIFSVLKVALGADPGAGA